MKHIDTRVWVGAGIVSAIAWMQACGGPSVAQQAAVAADALAQKECIDKGETKAEIDACRDKVKARRDAGQ